LGSVDEVGLAGKRMLEKGYIHCWGPGRHGPGSNYFQYFRDPWNSISEYFCDMDYIAADSDWQAQTWLNSDAAAYWGSELPADFLTNFEALGSA
ncbi:MAG: dioxygenase, partial [Rhodospirillales bacterium]|nr:dioxygenase [Rhodospirillales bacterium]